MARAVYLDPARESHDWNPKSKDLASELANIAEEHPGRCFFIGPKYANHTLYASTVFKQGNGSIKQRPHAVSLIVATWRILEMAPADSRSQDQSGSQLGSVSLLLVVCCRSWDDCSWLTSGVASI
jgi:hypothetical protein